MEPWKILVGRMKELATDVIEHLPQIGFALFFLVLTAIVAKLAVVIFRKAISRTKLRPALVEVFTKLISIIIWIMGTMIAATILFPTLTPGNLLAGLGIGSIAIGFAFKDIFENFVAGIFILLREPMRIGDFVECEGVEGYVETITLRDTYIRRTDGQLVLVPNAMLFTNPVFVLTDRAQRRTSIICGVAYGEDVDEARDVIEEAVKSVRSVETGRGVQIFAKEFSSSSVDFEITWWTGSKPVEIRQSRDSVVAAIKRALDDAGIEIPFPYRTLTFKEPLALDASDQAGQAAKKAEPRTKEDASEKETSD